MKLWCGVIVFLTVMMSSLPAPAQEPQGSDQLASELRRLSASVDRLTERLDAQSKERQEDIGYRKLELAIAYLNFRTRRIESLEREIESTKSLRTRMEDSLPMFSERISELEADMQEYPQGAPQELKESHKGLLMQYTLAKERIARLGDQIILRENLLYELQTEIRDVEDFVQKNLEM